MIVSSSDGQYWLAPSLGLGDELPNHEGHGGPGLYVTGEIAQVLTLNNDIDERVDLDVEFWGEECPLDLNEYRADWPHVFSTTLTCTAPLWVVTSERVHESQVTDGPGRFNSVLLMREADDLLLLSPDAPREQHWLHCWRSG